MATVTGFTAERMLEIENSTVVDGEVQGDNLILQTRDGTPINAGSVRGPQGVPGPAVRHVVQEEGASLPDRPSLSFVGQGVTASDDAANNKTLITIPTAGHVIQDEGTVRPQRASLNFGGLRISAADDPGNNRTHVALSDALLAYQGSWSASVYQNRDVVLRHGAYWVWENATPSTAAEQPGVGTTSWFLMSGVPVMTGTVINAWDNPRNGNQVWNLDTNRLFVYENAWVAAISLPYIDSRYGVCIGGDITTSTPTNWGIDITFTAPIGATFVDFNFVMVAAAIGTGVGTFNLNILIDTVNQQNLGSQNIPQDSASTFAYSMTRGIASGANIRFTTQARRTSGTTGIRASLSHYMIMAIFHN